MDKNCIHWKENLIFCWLLWSLIVFKKTIFFKHYRTLLMHGKDWNLLRKVSRSGYCPNCKGSLTFKKKNLILPTYSRKVWKTITNEIQFLLTDLNALIIWLRSSDIDVKFTKNGLRAKKKCFRVKTILDVDLINWR